ncbi:MAG: hypothetical protein R6U85_02890, partial [Salinivirgaceae bacterium]
PITGEYGAAYEQFGLEPVLFFKVVPQVFFNQVFTVLAVTLAISIYPYYYIRRLNTIDAIRGN